MCLGSPERPGCGHPRGRCLFPTLSPAPQHNPLSQALPQAERGQVLATSPLLFSASWEDHGLRLPGHDQPVPWPVLSRTPITEARGRADAFQAQELEPRRGAADGKGRGPLGATQRPHRATCVWKFL